MATKVANDGLSGSIGLDKLNTTGTASGSTYLRGDGAWSTVSSGETNSPYFKFALAGSATIGTGFPQDDLLNFGTETFKSTGFASWDGSNNRVVPNTAGYYYINAQVKGSTSSSFTRFNIQIRKNGTNVATGAANYGNAGTVATSSLIQFNGTSDYLDLVISHNHTGNVDLSTNNGHTFIQGFFVAS